MKKIFITGASGSGKSTIGAELRNRYIPVIDIDDVIGSCNWYYKKTHEIVEYSPGVGKQWLYDHEWLCDFEQIKSKIDFFRDSEIVAVVGKTSNEFDFLDYFDQVFVLQIDDKILHKRLSTRTTNNFASDPSEIDYILERKVVFEKEIIARGAVPVDATQPINILADKILGSMDKQVANRA